MKMRLASLCLATLGGLGTMLIPATSEAANIGYYEMCSGQGLAWQASAISAAGHTPVLINTPDMVSLNHLSALFVANCSNDGYPVEYTSNLSTINNAVSAHGLLLIMHDRHVTTAGTVLPGAASIAFTREYASGGSDINFPVGSPVISGPGGVLNDSSLDGYTYSSHGYVTISSLPGGSSAYAVRADSSQATVVSYPAGAGRVVYSTSPLDHYQLGGNWGVYAINLLAGLTYPAPVNLQSCTSEGYTSTKLEWCKNICERGYTGATLDMWIRRWVDRYRTLPYCAVEPQQPIPTLH